MENKWYGIIYNALFIAGTIIVLSTFASNTPSSLTGTIVGYSFIAIGTLLMVGYLLNNLNNVSASAGASSSIISSLITVGPFVLLIGIIVYMIYLLSFYFSKITGGYVSSGYYMFMNLFVLVLMIEFFTFYSGMQDKNYKLTGKIGNVTGMLLYFLEIINIIIVISLGIILKHFSTDG
jgi:hypothetical protein